MNKLEVQFVITRILSLNAEMFYHSHGYQLFLSRGSLRFILLK